MLLPSPAREYIFHKINLSDLIFNNLRLGFITVVIASGEGQERVSRLGKLS